jgi:hypothetical protein
MSSQIDLSGTYPTHIIYIKAIGSATINVNCITEDTKILTPSGYIRVDQLCIGDEVITDKKKIVKIKNIMKDEFDGTPETYPYLIKQGSIAPNYPPKNVKLSGNHMIEYGGKWIAPSRSNMFKQIKVDKVKYYHVQLQNYVTDNLVVNGGAVVESYTGDEHNLDYHLEWMRRYNNVPDKLYKYVVKHFEEKNKNKKIYKNKQITKNIIKKNI